MSGRGEYRNRNYPEPEAKPPEAQMEELRRRVERLENVVSHLQSQRNVDEPAIEHAAAEYRQRQIGVVLGLISLVFILPFLLCNR